MAQDERRRILADLNRQQWDHKSPRLGVEGVGDPRVEEQTQSHDDDHSPLRRLAGHVQQRRLEADIHPHAEHSDKQDGGLCCASPGHMLIEVMSQLVCFPRFPETSEPGLILQTWRKEVSVAANEEVPGRAA